MGIELFVVMPVHDEAECVHGVVVEWIAALRATLSDFVLCCLDDGSTDATPVILAELAGEIPELEIVRQPNAGHGRTCVAGYHRALAYGAQWVLQVDSDGQCDPCWLPDFWKQREGADLVYGVRTRREDGLARRAISRATALVTAAATGVRVRDPNVPYRLMRASALAPSLERIPPDVELANVALAVLHERHVGIRWIPIGFRARRGGRPSLGWLGLAWRGARLWRELRAAVPRA